MLGSGAGLDWFSRSATFAVANARSPLTLQRIPQYATGIFRLLVRVQYAETKSKLKTVQKDGSKFTLGSGGRTRTCDLMVMSHASCRCSTPRRRHVMVRLPQCQQNKFPDIVGNLTKPSPPIFKNPLLKM